MVKIRFCEICGEPFEVVHRSIYCSPACQREAQKRQQREYATRVKSQEKKDLAEARAMKHPVVKKRKSKIDKINAEAQKRGMTYGQYQAMKYIAERDNKQWLNAECLQRR